MEILTMVIKEQLQTYKNIRKFFYCDEFCANKGRAVSTKLTFLPTFCFKRQILDLYLIDLNNRKQNTTAFSPREPDKKSLKAHY